MNKKDFESISDEISKQTNKIIEMEKNQEEICKDYTKFLSSLSRETLQVATKEEINCLFSLMSFFQKLNLEQTQLLLLYIERTESLIIKNGILESGIFEYLFERVTAENK